MVTKQCVTNVAGATRKVVNSNMIETAYTDR